MTKKDYIFIANAIKEYWEPPFNPPIAFIEFLAVKLKKDNPNFNEEKFINACQREI